MRDGTVVFHLGGAAGGTYHLERRGRNARVVDAAESELDQEPLLEVRGDAETIRAIIDGEKDATKQFFAGGIRVRGDLRHLSDVALELGLIERPL
jgi:SCP-2 sterol transfer family